jgi:hypothetical protein
MEMPKPTTDHERLQSLVGNWFGEEQLNPSLWDPKGGLAEGHVPNRLALDGFASFKNISRLEKECEP